MADFSNASASETSEMSISTRVLSVNPHKAGRLVFNSQLRSFLGEWDYVLNEASEDASHLKEASRHLLHSNRPVAFPTETVYGLGADATRSAAVQGIYKAKQRPSDNPLIVHVCSLKQLRSLLRSSPHATEKAATMLTNGHDVTEDQDPIPSIYFPLIERFWPGPLTIILPNPVDSALAPEVTAGLDTFGARMPNNLLALALIRTAGIPLAAPSANASTKPSPTTYEHVYHDMKDRIDIILDGGPCSVGVESTVVDGLSDPPTILRPGGVSIDQLRECKGWSNVVIGYKDGSEHGSKPKAPGMKYKHYSPKANVVLHEAGSKLSLSSFKDYVGEKKSVGIIRTLKWPRYCGVPAAVLDQPGVSVSQNSTSTLQPLVDNDITSGLITPAETTTISFQWQTAEIRASDFNEDVNDHSLITFYDVSLGNSIPSIAKGLFSALRFLDEKGTDVIFVEGIEDEGDIAAAVMNRLRKAAGDNVVRGNC